MLTYWLILASFVIKLLPYLLINAKQHTNTKSVLTRLLCILHHTAAIPSVLNTTNKVLSSVLEEAEPVNQNGHTPDFKP